jgi:plastocyanin
MSVRASISALALIVLAVPRMMGQIGDIPSGAGVDLTGGVVLLGRGSGAREKDCSKVVVWLVPLDAGYAGRPASRAMPHRMAQHNKMFEPNFLVVTVGSAVDFPNLDPWFHNVFSLYRGKRFDLGLYEAGSHREVRFDRPGASYVFCNIHPQMSAVVLAVDSDLWGVSGQSGRVTIEGVPPGRYELRVWYEFTATEALDALARPIVVADDSRSLPSISIPVTEEKTRKHLNKYGHDYDSPDTAPTY